MSEVGSYLGVSMAELMSFITKPPEYGNTNPTVRYDMSVLCCAVLCCAVLCCAVLYCTALYFVKQTSLHFTATTASVLSK